MSWRKAQEIHLSRGVSTPIIPHQGHGELSPLLFGSLPLSAQERSLTPFHHNTRASCPGSGDFTGTAILCPQDSAQLPSPWLLPASLTCISCLHLSHSADVQPSLPPYPASPSQYQDGVNTAVIYTSSASPASWHVSRCFLFLLCFPHPLPPGSFYKTQFAGTSQGVFLGLPHGIQLPVREAGGEFSIATSQKGVWRPRERFQHLPKVSPALEEPRVQSRVSVPTPCVECKEKEDNYPLPSPPLCHPQP